MLYLGLISGTSADGIDAALMQTEPSLTLRHARTYPYPERIRAQILALQTSAAPIDLDALATLDARIGLAFADAARALITEAEIAPTSIRAIGSHGQTIRHRPNANPAFTLQLGDPNRIAEALGIDTVADFRRRDVAAGGQGAPLVPAFHRAILANHVHPAVILNIGGIANISVVDPHSSEVIGFDCGPGNGLMDQWCERHFGQPFDRDGAWACSAIADPALLQTLLAVPYFALPPPKSSGREVFHLDWLHAQPGVQSLDPAIVQATLLALTVRTIADAIARYAPTTQHVYVHGGGWRNLGLRHALRAAIPASIQSTRAIGIDPDFVEAAAFAWLAQAFVEGRAGNCAEATGARGPRRLGALYPGGPAGSAMAST